MENVRMVQITEETKRNTITDTDTNEEETETWNFTRLRTNRN